MPNTKGYLYILANPSIKGLVKIGYSDRDPSLRMSELFSTGVPEKFILLYEALILDPHECEKIVHQQLSQFRYRLNREYFSLTGELAIALVKNILLSAGITVLHEEKRVNLVAGEDSKAEYLSMLSSMKSKSINFFENYNKLSEFYNKEIPEWFDIFYFRQLSFQVRKFIWHKLVVRGKLFEGCELLLFLGGLYFNKFETESIPRPLADMLDDQIFAAAVLKKTEGHQPRGLPPNWLSLTYREKVRALGNIRS
jgi:hypothetical protein